MRNASIMALIRKPFDPRHHRFSHNNSLSSKKKNIPIHPQNNKQGPRRVLDKVRSFAYRTFTIIPHHYQHMPEFIHFAVAWDWELDREFITRLEYDITSRGLRFYSVSHQNLDTTCSASSAVSCSSWHSSTVHPTRTNVSSPFPDGFAKTRSFMINPVDAMKHASDKATMHLEFLTHGIDVPFTIIISPYSKKQEVELSLSDLAKLGRPFIIKPANTTGGGVGVILGAETLKDILDSRQHHKNDKYLLQQEIRPSALGWSQGMVSGISRYSIEFCLAGGIR